MIAAILLPVHIDNRLQNEPLYIFVYSGRTHKRRMRMLKKICLAMLAVMMTANVALAERTIVFAHDATWPPMEYMSADKKVVGYAVDYMDAVAKEAGFTAEHRNVAWDGIFAGLANGEYDAIASSVSITEQRKRAMDFSIPYFEVKQAVVLNKSVEAKSFADLKGKTLGAQIGTTGYFAIKKAEGVTPRSFDEIGLAMEALYNGNIDGVVCDDPVAANYALQQEEYAKRLKIAFIVEAEEKEYYGVAVNKGNSEVLALIDKGIKAVKEKGIEEQLRKKWIGQ